jgi:hypothetical protein
MSKTFIDAIWQTTFSTDNHSYSAEMKKNWRIITKAHFTLQYLQHEGNYKSVLLRAIKTHTAREEKSYSTYLKYSESSMEGNVTFVCHVT